MVRVVCGAVAIALLSSCGGVVSVDDAGAEVGHDAGPGGGGSSCTPDTWANYGLAFFTSNCASCHSYNHASLKNQSYVQLDHVGITSRVSSGNMPQGGAGLSQADRTRLVKYVTCGAP